MKSYEHYGGDGREHVLGTGMSEYMSGSSLEAEMR